MLMKRKQTFILLQVNFRITTYIEFPNFLSELRRILDVPLGRHQVPILDITDFFLNLPVFIVGEYMNICFKFIVCSMVYSGKQTQRKLYRKTESQIEK